MWLLVQYFPEKMSMLFVADWSRILRSPCSFHFADMFGGRDLTGIALQGIDHVISLSLVGDRVMWRTYSIIFKASDSKVPRVELINMGPSLDMTIRRQHVPSLDLDKLAHKSVPAT